MTAAGTNAELELPSGREQLADQTVEFALGVVSSSGLCSRLEAECKEATGRRRSLPVAALLAGLFLLALEDRPLHLLAVTELLYRRCSPRSQAALGVVGEAAEPKAFLARYRCVRYLFHKILRRRDPSGLVKNRRLVAAELEERSVTLLPEEQLQRRESLESLCNELVEASLSLLRPEEREAFSGAVGLDATPVKLFSRGPSRRSGLCASDPDGGWYVREGDHRGEEDQRGRVRGKVAWALEATLATMAPPVGDPAAHPNLALSMALGRPGEDPGGTGARVLASLARRGHKTGPVGNDRAYSSARPEGFHLPVAALGFELVFDYRIDECGIQASSSGAILVEGQWCCPAMPKDLINATIDHRSKVIDDERYDKRLTARADYRLYRKDGPDADGYERFSCPASGKRPRLICALRPASLSPRDGRTKVLHPPERPPACCVQGSITIAPDVGAKHRQHLVFGSETWRRTYATCRNAIEGKNGFLKDPAHECLGEPARRRVRGIAAQSLFVAVLLMAANVRALRAHRELVGATGGRERAAARARRRRTSLADFSPQT